MKILLIGELCYDIWKYGNVPRLNPESPSPIFVESYENQNLGMAGNVAATLANLDISFDFIHQPEKITKTRYVDQKSNYILLRVDVDNKISPRIGIDHLTVGVYNYDFIIISDYNKGFLTEKYLQDVISMASFAKKEVYIDTKKILGDWSYNAWAKINDKEYQDNLKNNAKINYDKTIITLGGQGAQYQNKIICPETEIDIRDQVGAGDTFLTFFSIYHHKTKDVEYSIKKANHFAGIACSHKGVLSDFGIKEKDL